VATVLVTGAAGFAGQHLLGALLRDGHDVVGGSLDGQSPPPGVLDQTSLDRVQWVVLDVTSEVSIRNVLERFRPGEVFHLAGQSSVGLSFSDVVGTWTTNATGTLLLLQGLIEAVPSARVLVVSSSEVYGAVPEHEQPIGEDRPPAPANPYAASKAAAEIITRQTSYTSDLQLVVARSFNHIGPGQSPQFALPNWAEQLGRMAAGEQEPVLRVGNLEARRDLLDVRDVVRAYRVLLESGAPGAVYNVCSGEAHRLHDVVEAMVEVSGTAATIEVDRERLRPVDIPLLVGDPTRLRALGWRPEISLRETLLDLLHGTRRPVA